MYNFLFIPFPSLFLCLIAALPKSVRHPGNCFFSLSRKRSKLLFVPFGKLIQRPFLFAAPAALFDHTVLTQLSGQLCFLFPGFLVLSGNRLDKHSLLSFSLNLHRSGLCFDFFCFFLYHIMWRHFYVPPPDELLSVFILTHPA